MCVRLWYPKCLKYSYHGYCIVQRDEKDTAFAQSYLIRVRDALKCEEKYSEFLSLLHAFETNTRDPTQVNLEICCIYESELAN